MIPLSSKLESHEQEFVELKGMLEEHQFMLGGNWTYDRGSFDRQLDEARKVWLRLPFEVISGNADSETDANEALIRLGRPYVLKHVYNEGLDVSAGVGGMVDQFQSPADPDAPVEEKWVDRAKQVLDEVERLFPQ